MKKQLTNKTWMRIEAIIAAGVILTTAGVWWMTRLNKEDCTQYETYDPVMGECYFECDSDAQCEDLAKKVDDALNAYFKGSKTRVSKSNPEPKPQQPAPTTTDTGTVDRQLTKQDTGSETNGTIYTVTSTGDLKPVPTGRDRDLWNLYMRIATKETIKQRLASFEVYENANDSSAASVWQASNPEKWHMNVNAAFIDNKKDLVHTMVHEFGHIVTLNSTQVSRITSACPNYSVPEGCTKNNSYLSAFYSKFWAKYGNNQPKSDYGSSQDDGSYQPASDQPMQPTPAPAQDSTSSAQPPEGYYDTEGGMYNTVVDGNGGDSSFVSEYAKSHPVEDLAETFAYFVLRPKPTDSTEAAQKIQSLYAYPELVTLRNRIRASLGADL